MVGRHFMFFPVGTNGAIYSYARPKLPLTHAQLLKITAFFLEARSLLLLSPQIVPKVFTCLPPVWCAAPLSRIFDSGPIAVSTHPGC